MRDFTEDLNRRRKDLNDKIERDDKDMKKSGSLVGGTFAANVLKRGIDTGIKIKENLIN